MKKSEDLEENLEVKTKQRQEFEINKGVELMLRGKKVRRPRSDFIFSKTVSIFRRQFKFTLEIDKNESTE